MRLQDNQHFSHHHILIPLKLNRESSGKIYCKACQEQILEEHYHGCLKCQHWIHDDCLNFPRSLEHPSHPSHPLTLLPKPTYSARAYTCNACGSAGNNFSMSCAHCEFDLHLHCASLPNFLILDQEIKHPHELKLHFTVPSSSSSSHDNAVFVCDICQSVMNPNQWMYYCGADGCDFSLHLDCAIPKRSSQEQKEEEESAGAGAGAGYYREGTPSGNDNEYLRQIEQLRMVSEAQEQLYAAQVKSRIEAQGRQAALDLIDPPRRYSYY